MLIASGITRGRFLIGVVVFLVGLIMMCKGTHLLGHPWGAGMMMGGFMMIAGSLAITKLVDGEWVTVEPTFWGGIVIGIISFVLGAWWAGIFN